MAVIAPGLARAQSTPQPGWTLSDASGDAVLRRTDPGADGPIDPPVLEGRQGKFPDIVKLHWGGWQPEVMWSPTPKKNFNGSFTSSLMPSMVRIDVTFKGLINPPGPLGIGGVYDPYRFGNSPLYGYIDIDLDGNINTGGELGFTATLRYLAMVARMGSMPTGPLRERVPITGAQVDGLFNTTPHFERSGADFTMAFCGCFLPEIIDEGTGDCDGVFEPGESWIVRGRFFQRAGGFMVASAAKNGSQPGAYDPLVYLRFEHCIADDTTTVSLVYAMTQLGAAKLRCGVCPVQPINLDVSDDTSIHEAMADICEGVRDPWFPVNFPETFTLAGGWGKDDEGEQALFPDKWTFRAALATAYSTEQPEAHLVWTDAGFDEHYADFTGDGQVTMHDRAELVSHVWFTDGSGFDCDPKRMGSTGVCLFGTNFTLFDLNYDGFVDGADAVLINDWLIGDFNGDCAVNTPDLVFLIGRFGSTGSSTVLTGDLTGDGSVTTPDITRFLTRFGNQCPPAFIPPNPAR
ncbi:MAG: hypothetical protein ACKVZJ_08195 [Phycisphaerales bacterium]